MHIVQIRLPHGPSPVYTLKVEARFSEILEGADVFRFLQWGPIMGDVMSNELPEEGPARRYPWIVISKRLEGAVGSPVFQQRVPRRVLTLQLWKKSPKSAF